ncbi:unnamed protein product [Allacma fusca]|uniref:Uncharacterized protein n=1 Tax=Allacma fusca TaxID=39272 RepID=A0A8J2NK98_9HEXA|nr:unnamed protein product [Allacma fusca]
MLFPEPFINKLRFSVVSVSVGIAIASYKKYWIQNLGTDIVILLIIFKLREFQRENVREADSPLKAYS